MTNVHSIPILKGFPDKELDKLTLQFILRIGWNFLIDTDLPIFAGVRDHYSIHFSVRFPGQTESWSVIMVKRP